MKLQWPPFAPQPLSWRQGQSLRPLPLESPWGPANHKGTGHSRYTLTPRRWERPVVPEPVYPQIPREVGGPRQGALEYSSSGPPVVRQLRYTPRLGRRWVKNFLTNRLILSGLKARGRG